MDGIHDMGGMHGFGPIEVEENEPAFHEPWEGRVMGIALHPYIMGQPHRISHLDEALGYILSHDGVWKTKGDEIADWYIEHCTEHYGAHLGGGD